MKHLLTAMLLTLAATQSFAEASLSISDGATYNFGNVVVGSNVDKVFIVSNTGDVAASAIKGKGLSAPFSFKGGAFPGTGGTCGSSLQVSSTCSFVVNFAPTNVSTNSNTVTVEYFGGSNVQTSSRPVQGSGSTPAILAISNGPNFNFGTQALGSTTDSTLTISNSGGYPATAISVTGMKDSIAFKGGSYPGVGGSCATSLAPAASCTLIITFAPTATGTITRTLAINYFDGAAAAVTSRSMSGTGATPALLIINNGPVYDYGSIAIGGSTSKTFTITNSGGVTANAISGSGLGHAFSYRGGSFPGTGGNCSSTLNASAACTFVVSFIPTNTGVQTGTINIGYNNGASMQSAARDVQGTGTAPASLTISDVGYDYGTHAVGSYTDKTFTLINSGGISASSLNGSGLTQPYSFKGGTYPGTGGTCATSLAAGATCTLIVSYAPISTGSHSSSINISYNNGVSATSVTRAITGSALTSGLLSISDGPTFDFGKIKTGSVSTKTFTLVNSGGITVSSMIGSGLAAPFTFSGGNSYPGAGGTCGTSLRPGQRCTVTVQYSPTVSGTHSDSIDISYVDGANYQTASRAITGASSPTGPTPPGPTPTNGAIVTISDVDYDFGTVTIGNYREKEFILKNTGSKPATGVSGWGLATPFEFKGLSYPGEGGTCGPTLYVGASCKIVVIFAPIEESFDKGSLIVGYHDGFLRQQSIREMSGQGVPAGMLEISEYPFANYGVVQVGTSADGQLTITNSGSSVVTGIAADMTGTGFTFKGGAYPGVGGNCGTSLAPSSTCTVIIDFTPTSVGRYEGAFTIHYNDGAWENGATRGMIGTGI